MARRTGGSQDQARVKWDRSMKLAVWLIHTEHDLPKKRRTAVFNSVFAKELQAFGLSEGTSANIVSAQWGERGKTNPDWVAIRHPRAEAANAHAWNLMRQRIDQALNGDTGDGDRSDGGRYQGDRDEGGRSSCNRDIGQNITVRAARTPANSPTAMTTPRARGMSVKAVAVASAPGSIPEHNAGLSMCTNMKARTTGVEPSSSRSTKTFKEALSRAALTPPPTPPSFARPDSTSKRHLKRQFGDADEDEDYSPNAKRSAIRQPKAVVMVPRTPRVNAPNVLKTPTKSPRRKRALPPKAAFCRNDGSSIMIREDQIDAISKEVQPVLAHKAHPPLPSLLFRCWEKDPSCDRNSETGFWARKYYKSNVIPHIPPPSMHIDPTDIFNHFDRKMVQTPFISTSNRFIWMVQLMIKNMKAGNGSWRVSVIDSSVLDKRTVFYARPFHDEVIKTRGFSNGAQHYRGSYEFMVWKQIPQEAIITTFRPQDLMELANTNPAIGSALQMEILCAPNASLSRTKIPMLRSTNVPLSQEITAGIAQLGIFLGLDAHSPVGHLSHVVSDVVEGWALVVQYREKEEWYDLAGVFARKLCKSSPQPVTFKERETAKFSFLNGVGWGCGEVNASYKPDLLVKKLKKATSVGLASPAQICSDMLDATKLSIVMFEKAQNTRLEKYHQQRLLHSAPRNDRIHVGVNDQFNIDIDMEGPLDVGMDGDETMAEDSDDEIVFIDHQLGL